MFFQRQRRRVIAAAILNFTVTVAPGSPPGSCCRGYDLSNPHVEQPFRSKPVNFYRKGMALEVVVLVVVVVIMLMIAAPMARTGHGDNLSAV